MKKGILLIASAAALVLGSNNAYAAAPTWYNFQGVCYEQNATITVQFDILNSNKDVIYSETHSGVKTNASGIFTLHVGEGEALEGAMPANSELTKGGLILVTNVNGMEVSRALFGAVPYASQAAAVGTHTAEEFDALYEEFQNLFETVGSYDDQIADLWETVQPVAGILPEYTKLVQEVAINTEGLAEAENAIIQLSPAVAGNTAAIAKLQEDVNINIEGISELEKAVSELSPAVAGNTGAISKLLEDVEDLKNTYAEDFQAQVITFEGMSNAVSELQQQMEGIYEMHETQAMAAITSLNNAVLDLENDIEANKDAIADIQGKMVEWALIPNNVTTLINKVKVNEEDIDDIQGQLVELAGIQNTITTLMKKVADLEAAVNK